MHCNFDMSILDKIQYKLSSGVMPPLSPTLMISLLVDKFDEIGVRVERSYSDNKYFEIMFEPSQLNDCMNILFPGVAFVEYLILRPNKLGEAYNFILTQPEGSMCIFNDRYNQVIVGFADKNVAVAFTLQIN